MAKNPSTNRADRGATPQDRAAKIKAAQKATSTGGANKITIAGIVAILAIIAVVGGVIWSQKGAEKDAGKGNTNPPAGATVAEGYRAFGNVTAKAGAPTVTVYEDFQCPICAQLESAVGATLGELGTAGDIVLRYHVMNFLDDKFSVKQSTPVATGAFCAADQGKFMEFHDAAFAGQHPEAQSIPEASLDAFATKAGVPDITAWKACVKAGKYDSYVAASNNSAGEQGVTGTPTVKINGTVADLGTIATPEGLRKAVADATK